MTPFVQDADFTLWHGDALEVLREMPTESVDCCVTSPPYWGLRDYGNDGQLGLESTPDEYVARLVDVFREVRRCLTDTATVWLNLGDSYAGSNASQGGDGSTGGLCRDGRPEATRLAGHARLQERLTSQRTPIKTGLGLKPKDLVGIPWRVAFALQADGWYLRSDIIWSKPNPMPESVTDRPTKAHEYVFLLSKSPRYWFDQEAVRERWEDGYKGRTDMGSQSEGRIGHTGSYGRGPDGRRITRVLGADGSLQHRDGERWPNGGRNIRSVWEIATQPYPEAHFAVFPEELARRCILAGCPEGGTVLDPFGGSGTTALVARKHRRRSILIELNEDYCALAGSRLQQLSLLAQRESDMSVGNEGR